MIRLPWISDRGGPTGRAALAPVAAVSTSVQVYRLSHSRVEAAVHPTWYSNRSIKDVTLWLTLALRRWVVEREAMQKNQRVADMAVDVLARQAGARAERTGEPFEDALKAVLETEAGRQLGELRDGPHGDERAERWQEDLPRKRANERTRAQQEERSRARQEELSRARHAAWKLFMQAERRELELRKDGQLAGLLGETLPGESPAALRRLASEDQRQAEEGLVALMSGGKVFYKQVEELSEEDMPARVAANRLRETWLKERLDGWLGRGEGLL